MFLSGMKIRNLILEDDRRIGLVIQFSFVRIVLRLIQQSGRTLHIGHPSNDRAMYQRV